VTVSHQYRGESVGRACAIVVAAVRLAGSTVAGEGRLEVNVGGHWGTVCDDSFTDVDAGVACSMLGLGCVSVVMSSLDNDREVVGSTPGQLAIEWLLLGWLTVCGQVNHLGI